jgi:AraC-like DNA-binding protein
MFTRQYKPSPGLEDFVHKIIVVHYRFDIATTPPTNPFPPHPHHTLYFYPYEKVTRIDPATGIAGHVPRSIYVGPMVSRVDLTMAHNTLVIIILFQPGGMYRLLHIPMEEWFGRSMESVLFEGSEIELVIEQIKETADYDRMNAIVQQFLLKKKGRLKILLPLDEALRYMQQKGLVLTVDQLAVLACVSTRQLERQFKERMGIPPKLFLKLTRFSKAWVMREHDPFSTWLHIAHACGYADQMHLIRDFKFFTGLTPKALQNHLDKSPLRLQASSLLED